MDSYHQESSFQLAGTRLVSNQANDPHPSAHAPTQQRQQHLKAIAVLKEEDERCILACLDVARALEPRIQQTSKYGCLTTDQVHAIRDLRHCENSDIRTWLHFARAPDPSRVPTLSASPQVGPTLDPGHPAPIITSDATTPGAINHSCENKVKQQPDTQGSSTRPSPPATNTPRQAKPKYYCTLCDRVRPFMNESGWKKHEKEHDTDYVCMRGGPKESTPQGIQCAFCGIQDPDDAHLFGHNAQACSPGSPGLPEGFSTKRGYEMVRHLRVKHGINIASQGEAIARKWKYTVKKQAWSCCFCVSVFASFNERLSHIATKHYGNGDSIEEWDATNVIQGLLQQPGMIKAWEEKLTSLPPWEIPADIIWERDAIKDLQQQLEVGPSDATTALVLVEAAYNACRVDWGMESKRPRALTAPEVDRTNDTTMLSSSRLPSPTTSPNMSVSNQNQPPSIFRVSNGLFANDLVNQDNPQVDHSYSSDFMPEWNDDEGQDSLFPGNYYQA